MKIAITINTIALMIGAVFFTYFSMIHAKFGIISMAIMFVINAGFFTYNLSKLK